MALLLGFILGAVAILFIIGNTDVVSLSFLQWQFESSIALVVILSLLVGALIALLLTLPGAIRTSFELRRLRKQNRAIAEEAVANRQAADHAHAQLASTPTAHPNVLNLSQ